MKAFIVVGKEVVEVELHGDVRVRGKVLSIDNLDHEGTVDIDSVYTSEYDARVAMNVEAANKLKFGDKVTTVIDGGRVYGVVVRIDQDTVRIATPECSLVFVYASMLTKAE